MNPDWSKIRGAAIFIGGMAGMANEAIRHGAERPTLILAWLAMIGFPIFLQRDKNGK